MKNNTKISALVAISRLMQESIDHRDNAVSMQTKCETKHLENWKQSENYWDTEYQNLQEAYDDLLNNY